MSDDGPFKKFSPATSGPSMPATPKTLPSSTPMTEQRSSATTGPARPNGSQ
jgi:hypothetical protein